MNRHASHYGSLPGEQRTQRPRGGTSLGFSVQAVDFQKLPKFSIAPSSLAETFKENWRSLISLAFWLIAPFAMAYLRFLRYDVR